jgi:hypothetical protein
VNSRDDAQLPKVVEAMLRHWPAPKRDEAHWQEAAAALVARLKDGSVGGSIDELLAPPLPAAQDEGSLSRTPAKPEVVRQTNGARRQPPAAGSKLSLAEMARARVGSKPVKPDATLIAKESLLLLKEARSTGALASTVAAAANSRKEARRRENSRVAELEQARAEREAATRRKAVQGAQTGQSRTSHLAAVALVALGLAAGAVLYVRMHDPEPRGVVLGPAPGAAQPPGAAPAAEGSQREETVDPAELEVSHEQPASAPPPAGGPLARKPAANATAKRSEAEQTRPRAAEPPSATAGQPGPEDPDEAEQLRPALGETGVPLEPSTGAVSSALGSALGSARRCVVGHDRPSKATVVFGSDGRVKSVAVSGPAARTPAETCIRAALSQARLPRFARPTFTVRGVTIRP